MKVMINYSILDMKIGEEIEHLVNVAISNIEAVQQRGFFPWMSILVKNYPQARGAGCRDGVFMTFESEKYFARKIIQRSALVVATVQIKLGLLEYLICLLRRHHRHFAVLGYCTTIQYKARTAHRTNDHGLPSFFQQRCRNPKQKTAALCSFAVVFRSSKSINILLPS